MTSEPMSLSRLPRDRKTPFELEYDSPARASVAQELGIDGIRKLRLRGDLAPLGARDWHLHATLGATVVQSCVVTLKPVVTRLDVPVERRFLADLEEPDPAEEVEMPSDDSIEPLPAKLDLDTLLQEALALHLPAYPRAEDADLGKAVFAAPGVAPMRDEDAKPLAGLAALKAKLEGGSDPES